MTSASIVSCVPAWRTRASFSSKTPASPGSASYSDAPSACASLKPVIASAAGLSAVITLLPSSDDQAADDGREDVVHQVAHFADFGKLRPRRFEQARVFDGDGGLIGEGFEQVQFVILEQRRQRAVIAVDDANRLAAHDQRHAQNAAQLVADDAFQALIARVAAGVVGQDRLAAAENLIDDRVADDELVADKLLAVDAARDAKFQRCRSPCW